MSKIVYLESTAKHKYIGDLKIKLEKSLEYFPELQDKTIYVGIATNRKRAKAYADIDNTLMAFLWDIEPKYVTVFHELMHFVQHTNDDNPKTEEWNSIYAMARMPNEFVDDDIPYISHDEISFCLLVDCCRDAIRYRENGNRNYIKYLKDKIKSISKYNKQKEYLENMKMLPVQTKLQV